MDREQRLVERFEADRPHLRAVAYRLLGSLSEADDALQDAWVRASRADIAAVENLSGWLTTVVTRVCLNLLRARGARREEPLDTWEPGTELPDGVDPEQEALTADAVGVALLVVLDALTPAERVAFVLHDMFAVPFDDIAPMIERSPAATRQLASRARRRVRGAAPAPEADLTRQREVVAAFLAATRAGHFASLLSLLDPDVVLRADAMVVPTPQPVTLRGAEIVAESALAAVGRAGFAGLALLDGAVGVVMAPFGRLRLVLAFTVVADRVTEIEVIAEPERLRRIDLVALDA
ncbi:sigma-70 family RNA polymerase sigma factor [Streptomyces hainanensis]|uniref:Sigma-70 family RNA polymerase sigma factor n=1 Tax=Streptomyces hainanensis TaxID=402648 RepID=A0A4R4SZS7_9ACTN|nr:sigma-70 family RNA polymerase sigma factor [Streptomyces hainanensis]TDC67553.1 sigma-70 family RNA polymerase sigma factor [Streptomyces hainanensis]